MAFAWKIPDEEYAKINLHYLERVDPLPNGNHNGLGIIVRNSSGVKIWGALGPFRDMTEIPTLIWGFQSCILAALSLGFRKMHIEMDNKEAYDTVRIQEFIILPPDQEDAFAQFNTLFANQFKDGETERMVSIIPIESNRTAEYMAAYGLDNFSSLVQTPAVFGNLQHFLDRDM